MKTKIIDELGDITATPGTREWAIGVKRKLILLIQERKATESHMTPYLELLEEHEGYRRLEDEGGKTFGSIADFINARYPFGLDGDDRVKSWIARAKERVMNAARGTTGEALQPERDGQSGKYKPMSNLDIGTQASKAKQSGVSRYTQHKLDHVARSRPDLLEQVQTGQLSAHKAYKIAKDIGEPAPLDHLRKWWGKATNEEKIQFLNWIEPNL